MKVGPPGPNPNVWDSITVTEGAFRAILRVVHLLPLLLTLSADWTSVPLPFKLTHGEGARKHLPATMPGGIAVFDFDRDGRPDIFFPNGGDLPSGLKSSPQHQNKMLRNLGGFRFADVTVPLGLAGTEYAFGAAAADFDGDGWPDLAVAELRGIRLYRNAGGKRFDDITATAGLGDRGQWAIGAAWVDIDSDGDLDLFVIRYVAWDPTKEPECKTAGRIDFCHPRYYPPQPNALYRNNGDGTFTEVGDSWGVTKHAGKGMSAAIADFDRNGRPDLFVTNDRLPSFLFLNRAPRFEELGLEWGVSVPMDGKPVSAMGADTQDYDGDGFADLIYTALRDETFPLYRGTGAGLEDASASSRLSVASRPYAGWGVMFADLDNDGQRDIVAATSDALSGQVDPSRKGPVVWFRNAGKGTFEPARALSPPAMYRGLVATDLDGDGCEDLVVTALGETARILKNPCGRKGGVRREWLGSTAVGYASSLCLR